MSQQVMTVAEIDKHIYAHAEKMGIKNLNQPLSAQQLRAINICAIYQTIRPILGLVQMILNLFKPTWASVVVTFQGVMDTECPAPPPVTGK